MNSLRNGNFTSSKIAALTALDRSGKSWGQTALTYIEEKNMERRLGRSLESDVNARAFSWGHLNERRVHELLGLDYQLCSATTLRHPSIDYWAGSPDFIKYYIDPAHNTVCDSKCPITLKSFCRLVDAMQIGVDALRAVVSNYKKVGEEYYYQLDSNAIITGCNYAELIVYCPYKSELDAIRDLAMNWDGPDQHQYKWIAYAQDDELPYLIDGGHYKNLNTLRFAIPQAEKDYLTDLVLKAGELLIPRQKVAA